jgi:hypothetical protein
MHDDPELQRKFPSILPNLDERQRRVRVTKEQFERVLLKRHKFHGEWNYTIRPRTAERMPNS